MQFSLSKMFRALSRNDSSVYFVTLHKAASTLMGKQVLPNIRSMKHVDYAAKIYMGETIDRIHFEEKNHVYGPIRITRKHEGREYRELISIFCETSFLSGKKVIFFIRDPRDILVSMYYSFAFSHGAPSETNQEELLKFRNSIQAKGIDAYVSENLHFMQIQFQIMKRLIEASSSKIVLKYEDMILNFDAFAEQLTQFVPLEKDILQQLREESRPRTVEDISSHKRSGKVGGFRDHLSQNTIDAINLKLSDELRQFNYQLI